LRGGPPRKAGPTRSAEEKRRRPLRKAAATEASGGVGGFGVDGYAGDLGEAFFYGVFEGGGDIVDAGDGEIALHGAVTGDEDVVLNLADANVVGVEEFVVGGRHVVEERFDGQFELAHFTGANVWRGDVAAERLDVNVDVNVSFAEAADAIFEFGGAAMGFAEGEIFIDFEVKFDE
jgi:hypothetical protein